MKKNNYKRVLMSKEDELFYTIKYGHAPIFRIEVVESSLSSDPSTTSYILTNIPKYNGEI